jgi:hypothetical protein
MNNDHSYFSVNCNDHFPFFTRFKLHVRAKMRVRVSVIVFNTTFNNISVISLRSVLLVEETRVPGENH